MEEINHFSHKKHSLKLFEKIVDVADKGKHGEVNCEGCQEPISNGSAYGCISCHFFLHRTCAQLKLTFIHYLHALHPLILTAFTRDQTFWSCDVCNRKMLAGFGYVCSPCNFVVCITCVVAATAQIDAATALKKEAAVKFRHEGHPQHTLTLQLRPALFFCDACRDEKKDFFYQCDDCNFWIHKNCASLSLTIDLPHHHKHPLFLLSSLPENFYNFDYYCELCTKRIMQTGSWIYHCSNCRYFMHIRCFLNADHFPTPIDGKRKGNDGDILQFPMSDMFLDPLKVLNSEKPTLDDDDTVDFNHWSHPHPLIINIEPQTHNNVESNDLIEVCHGCVRPISLPYYTCTLHGCSFSLHKYCAQLPLTLQHQLHLHHELHLVDTSLHRYLYQCSGCYSLGNGFAYTCRICGFYLDVNCAYLPGTIKHKSHNHPLIQLMDPKTLCKACNEPYPGISYTCKACDFHLNRECAMKMPHFLSHRYCKGHQIPLTYPLVQDHPEDFYCDICEEEMHPKRPLYHCQDCKNSFHLGCISRIDHFANLNYSHKHPLTFVRRMKMANDVCSKCCGDINGYLILECRARVCNFQICFKCHCKKRISFLTM